MFFFLSERISRSVSAERGLMETSFVDPRTIDIPTKPVIATLVDKLALFSHTGHANSKYFDQPILNIEVNNVKSIQTVLIRKMVLTHVMLNKLRWHSHF